jgi:hypothetical protein
VKSKRERIRQSKINRIKAYKESAAINFLMGLIFILGGIFNTGRPGGTVFMFVIGCLMWWCAYDDSKGPKPRKTSAFSEHWFKKTNKSRLAAGLEPFERPDDIPTHEAKPEAFPFGALVVIFILIIAVLIFHYSTIVPYQNAKEKIGSACGSDKPLEQVNKEAP